MGQLLLLSAVPLILTLLSLCAADARSIRRIVAAMLWVHLGVVAWFMAPLFSGAKTLLCFAPDFCVDKLAASFVMLTAAVVCCAATHADTFFAGEAERGHVPNPAHFKVFYACLNMFLLAMSAVFMCDNLGYIWISIEATTLFSAPLVYFDRTKNALEATWKYLIICSVGIAFALLGTVFIFASSQHGAISAGSLNITQLVAHASELDYSLLRLGFIFCLLGYGTKAGIFPLHSWLPDAHSEAPAPASAILSGALLNCALFGIWRVSRIVVASRHHAFTYEMVTVLGTLTVVAAAIFLIRQHSFKRMWAYSSIENVGLILVAIGIGSGALFFLQALNHSLAKVALFLLSGNIAQAAGSKRLHDLHGIWNASPPLGFLLAMATLAVTGAPPFGAFVSEMLIFQSSASPAHWLVAVLLVAAVAIAFVAVISHVGRILLGGAKADFRAFKPVRASLVPGALVLASLLMGVLANPRFWEGL